MITKMLGSVATKDGLETWLGRLRLVDGCSTPATKKLFCLNPNLARAGKRCGASTGRSIRGSIATGRRQILRPSSVWIASFSKGPPPPIPPAFRCV